MHNPPRHRNSPIGMIVGMVAFLVVAALLLRLGIDAFTAAQHQFQYAIDAVTHRLMSLFDLGNYLPPLP